MAKVYRIFVFAGNILFLDNYWENDNKSGLSIEKGNGLSQLLEE